MSNFGSSVVGDRDSDDAADDSRNAISGPLSLRQPHELRLSRLAAQADETCEGLAVTSRQINDVISVIPADLGNIGDRICGILTAALAEAEGIRAEARSFADEIRNSARERAATMINNARDERRALMEMRAEAEAERVHIRAEAAELHDTATRQAADIIARAEARAADLLVQTNQSLDKQAVNARERLSELETARMTLIEQLQSFYAKFNNMTDGDSDIIDVVSWDLGHGEQAGSHPTGPPVVGGEAHSTERSPSRDAPDSSRQADSRHGEDDSSEPLDAAIEVRRPLRAEANEDKNLLSETTNHSKDKDIPTWLT